MQDAILICIHRTVKVNVLERFTPDRTHPALNRVRSDVAKDDIFIDPTISLKMQVWSTRDHTEDHINITSVARPLDNIR